jgi:hypothetical protein
MATSEEVAQYAGSHGRSMDQHVSAMKRARAFMPQLPLLDMNPM